MKALGYLSARVDDLVALQKLDNPFLKLQYDAAMATSDFRLPQNTRGTEAMTVLLNELQKVWLGDVKLTPGLMKEVKSAVQEVVDKPF
jgi:hypothetical protein